MTSSKKARPCAGRSSTCVSANSACRIDRSQRTPAARSPGSNGCGSRASHLRASASIRSAVSSRAIACIASGSAQLRTPLSSASKAMPRFSSWRLTYSWPFRQNFVLYGKYERNFTNSGPKSSSTAYM